MEGAKGPQGRRLPAARDAAEPAGVPDEAPLAGGLRVRLKDVAAHAGVSRATVSLVLRKSPLVKAETRAKVEEAMAGLGYVYNRSAANLRSGASRTVGLVLCEIITPNFAQFTAGIDEVLGTEGYMAFIGNAAEDAARQREVLVRMQEHGVDGLVVVASENTRADALEEGACARIPCVLAQRRVEGFPADYVGPDYGAGMELITEHLIALGHRNIAFIGGVRRIAPLAERMAGFHRALRRHKLKSGPVVPCAVIERSSGYAAARELLAKGEIPSAIVCYNDVVALGVMLALDERGLVPGRDVAVVGCDDVDEAGLHRPALTTFTTDPRVVGREAARLLLRRIAHPDRPRDEIIVPPRLVIRQSCGAGKAAEGAGAARPTATRPTGGAR